MAPEPIPADVFTGILNILVKYVVAASILCVKY